MLTATKIMDCRKRIRASTYRGLNPTTEYAEIVSVFDEA